MENRLILKLLHLYISNADAQVKKQQIGTHRCEKEYVIDLLKIEANLINSALNYRIPFLILRLKNLLLLSLPSKNCDNYIRLKSDIDAILFACKGKFIPSEKRTNKHLQKI